MSKDQKLISFEDAQQFLPEGEEVHTFRQGGPALVGCHWDKKDLLKAMKQSSIEITGEMAQSMKHGLAIQDKMGWLFIETARRTDEDDK